MTQSLLPLPGITSPMRRSWPQLPPCQPQGRQRPDLLAQLARASQDRPGWILLLAPPGQPLPQALAARGIDPARVILIPPTRIKDWQRTLEQSLGNGRFSAVLSWLPADVPLDLQALEQARRQSGTLAHFFDPVTPLSPEAGYQPLLQNH